jgi:hypothetical protein
MLEPPVLPLVQVPDRLALREPLLEQSPAPPQLL